MLRYGIYARKSHDKREVTEKSTGEQVAEANALAARDDLQVVWKGEESKSAKTPNQRPLYDELIGLIEKGKVNAILCWHVNRLVRNMEEGGALVQLLVDGKLREIRTPHACYRTQESILPLVIEAACATQYSIDQSNIVHRSMQGNFEHGGWNHKAPPGYLNVRDRLNSKRGQVILDPERYQTILKAWHLMLTGSVSESEVWRKLRDEWAYRTRETLKRPSDRMCFSSVQAMFRNVFYAGYVKVQGEIRKGRHEPLVTLDQFQQVQRILASRSFKVSRRYDHPYTGILKCSFCGQAITAELKRLRNGSIWEVYHCADSYNRCTKRGMSAKQLNAALNELVQSMQIDPELRSLAINEIKKHLDESSSIAVNDAGSKEALKEVETRLERLSEMWLSGLLTDPARYRHLELSLKEQREKLQLKAIARQNEQETFEVRLNRLKALLDNVDNLPEVISTQKRPIFQALGQILFNGQQKSVSLTLRPVLHEFIAFSRQVMQPLEPPESCSQKQNRASSEKTLCFGRSKGDPIEVPESLVKALLDDPLPNLDDTPFRSDAKSDV